MPDGSFVRVALKESPIFSPELQARHSEIRTYHGVGVDDPSIQGRLDFAPAGFHAMLFTDDGVVFVDPAQRGDASRYISYWKADVAGKAFTCDVHGVTPSEFLPKLFPANNPSGTQLRTYRLAVSVTGEYTTLFGGAAGAASQIATTVNRVTGIYEREVAIRLNLVATRIFTDSATDPFPQAACDLRSENQTELDANAGDANYDVGHEFSAGGNGGVASGGSVCVGGSKARGCTSLGNPSGDAFDVDFVAHEIGHQFGGNHTWSGDAVSRNFSIADTKVPLLGARSNVLAECTSPPGTPVSLGFATASDLCDASPAVTNDAPAVFALGIRTVTWTARDASSNQSTATQLVTIQDTVAPSIAAPPDITAECTSPTGTPVALGTPVVSDTCDASPAVTNDAPAAFPLGIRTVIWTARDSSSNQGTSAQTVKVEDTTAPTVQASLGETMLWPANHNLTNVRLGASVSEACDSNPAIEVKVFGNEDDETPTGDGNFSPDASAIALNSLRLRSERKGDGDGRVYLVVVRATDASGNAGIDCMTVVVPHDQSKSSIASVNAQAAAAKAFCLANNGTAPAGYFVVGDGPITGNKQ